MSQLLCGLLTVLGRVLVCLIFLMAAVGHDIPDFSGTTRTMELAGIPSPQLMLVGAIAFLILGGLSVSLGFLARFGATLLLVFLVLASYYFHNFWVLTEEAQIEQQMIHFFKNLSMMGTMLFIMANGSGPMSLDRLFFHPSTATAAQQPALANVH
jgi:putative oxidoreductase